MRWKVAIDGGGKKEKRDEAQNSAERGGQPASGGTGMQPDYGRDMRSDAGRMAGYPPMPHPMHMPPEPMQYGGVGAMNMGLYGGGGGSPAPVGREMGYLADWPEEPESRHRSRRTGRFVRGADDGEIYNHGGRRRRYEQEERGFGEEEDETRELKRRIRKLEQNLEKTLDRLEELRPEKETSGSRRKNEDEDEDEEDDPAALLVKILSATDGGDFLKELPALFRGALSVIKSPPETWPPYLEKKDHAGLWRMESKELEKALEGLKSGKPPKDAEKELYHALAALILTACHALHEK